MDGISDTTVEESAGAGILRTALAGLPKLSVAGLPEGMVCILTRTVVDAGIDPWDVRAWLYRASGFEAHTYLRTNGGTDGGRPRAPINPEPYFAIPVRALLPPR